jgi:hypothetical protein
MDGEGGERDKGAKNNGEEGDTYLSLDKNGICSHKYELYVNIQMWK